MHQINYNDIRFKTTILKSGLFDYSNAYTPVKGRIKITGVRANITSRWKSKDVMFKNWAPFINCKSEINNTEIYNGNDIDIVMPMNNLIEYSKHYAKHLEVYGNITEMSQMIT